VGFEAESCLEERESTMLRNSFWKFLVYVLSSVWYSCNSLARVVFFWYPHFGIGFVVVKLLIVGCLFTFLLFHSHVATVLKYFPS